MMWFKFKVLQKIEMKFCFCIDKRKGNVWYCLQFIKFMRHYAFNFKWKVTRPSFNDILKVCCIYPANDVEFLVACLISYSFFIKRTSHTAQVRIIVWYYGNILHLLNFFFSWPVELKTRDLGIVKVLKLKSISFVFLVNMSYFIHTVWCFCTFCHFLAKQF